MITCLPLSLSRIFRIACYLLGAMAAILMAPPVMAQQPVILTNGLIMHLPFDGNLNDKSGNNNIGSCNNPQFRLDRFGGTNRSVLVNSFDSSIEIKNLNGSKYQPVTYCLWLNLIENIRNDQISPIGYQGGLKIIIGREQAGIEDQGAVTIYTELVNGLTNNIVYYTGASGATTPIVPVTNAWFHLVISYSNEGDVYFYIDGKQRHHTMFQAAQSATIPFKIGASSTTSQVSRPPLNGLVDNVRIYNRALSESEVKSLYTYESTPPNPVSITSQPTSIITDLGKDVSFSVSATNAITYQWFKDGRILTGETNSDIHINYPQFNQTGSYNVLVSNEAGSIESKSAKLTLRGGRVVAWGAKNRNGETTVPAGLEDVVAVSAGYLHSVALRGDGSVVAWGANWNGRCDVPINLSNVVDIVSDNFSAALVKNGDFVKWGKDGDGNPYPPNIPQIKNAKSVALGDSHVTVLNNDSTVTGYGNNYFGQTNVPVGLRNVVQIAAHEHFSVALRRDGTVAAWGINEYKQTNVPSGLKNVRQIATSGRHCLALLNDGSVIAWGWNEFGQATVPEGLKRVIAISAAKGHSLALKDDNTIVAWGRNDIGQCDVPKGLKGVIGISTFYDHNLAIVSDSLFPPVIKQNITPLTVDSGQLAEFKIDARNAASYQWFKDGNALPNATNSVLSLTNARPVLIGDYFAVASNAYGTATSSVASLNIKGVDAGNWNGLVAYYPFNGNANDESGNLLSGKTISGSSLRLANDRFGQPLSALYSDSQQSIVCPTKNLLPKLNSQRTISLWFNVSSSNAVQTLFDYGAAQQKQRFGILLYSGFLYFSGFNYDLSTSVPFIANRWNHYLVTYDGLNMSFYLNGVLSFTTVNANYPLPLPLSSLNSVDSGSHRFGIGIQGNEEAVGLIDDARIYNRALSESDVKALYESERVPDTIIANQSQSLSLATGAKATFSVIATNSSPLVNLTYQWQKDGNPIPGATNSFLTITNVQPVNIGDYNVIVSGGFQAVTSAAAALSIDGVNSGIWKGLVAQYLFSQNTIDSSVWGNNLKIVDQIAFSGDRYGAQDSSVNFRREISNGLMLERINGLNTNNNSEITISFWSRNIEEDTYDEQWSTINGIPTVYATSYIYQEPAVGVMGFHGKNKYFRIFCPSPSQSVKYIINDFDIVYNKWVFITVTARPDVHKIFVNGALASESYANNWRLLPDKALYIGCVPWNLGSNASIGKMAGDIDNLRIYNRVLSESEVKTLYESERVPDTIIVTQPQSLSLSAGAKDTFSVFATNSSPLVSLTYQWQKDGNPIPGATNSLLTITNVQPVNIGDYNVVVSGGFLAVTSASASLNIEGVNSGIWRGLVAWYPFENSISDKSLYLGSGIMRLGSYGVGRFGLLKSSLELEPPNDILLNVEKSVLPIGDDDRTFSVWVKLNKSQALHTVMWYGSTATNGGAYGMFLENAAINFNPFPLPKDPRFITSTDQLDGYWHQIVWVVKSKIKSALCYLDGVLLPDLSFGFSAESMIKTQYSPIRIGSFSNDSALSQQFYGRLDDLRIYNRCLSAGEVTALYQSERVPDSVITRQPQSASVAVGGSVRLVVEASNPIPTVQFAYQWFKDGAKLVGATNLSLNLGQLRLEQIGTYTVTVDDGSRTLTSIAANVSIQGVDSSIWKGLVASYAFEGDFSDSSGFGDSLVPYGVVNFVDQGRRPETKVARVNGLDGFLVGPERAWFSGVQPRTVSVWIKPEATSTNVSTVLTLGGFENCAQRFSLQVPVAQNGIRFDGGDCTNGLRSKTFTGASISGKWTHAVLTYDGSSIRCYVNGLVSGTAYTVALNTDPIAPLVIGNTVGLDSEGFTGLVDDVRIYNRSLSAMEVRALFNYESTGVAPSLPQITRQPTPVIGYEGETLKLSVEATGYQLGYQWQRGGQNLVSDVRLSGINSSELQIKGARLDDGGDYRVLVTNSFGAVTSSTVKLTVAPPVRSLVAGLANEVQEGQRMTFPLSMVSTGDVGGLTFKLSYNPAFLTDPKVEWSAVVGQSVNTVNTSVAGEISGSFSLAGTALASGTAALGTVDFRARSVPAQTNVVLSPAVVSVANPSGTLLAAGNGAIAGEGRIRPRKIKGDNNANQRIDIGDAVVVSKLLVGLEETRSWDVGLNDLNASQSLDNGDVIKALRTVVGLDPQPSPGSEGKRLAMALGFAKVLVNTNDAMAIELLDGPKATVGQPYRVAVRLNRVKGNLSGLSFAMKYPASLSLTDKQVGAMVPGDALPFWNESAGQVSLAAIRSTAWANATGVAAVLTFVPNATFSGQAEWPLKLEQVEITGSGFDVRPVDPVAVVFQSGGGTVNTPPQISLQPPKADGSMTLEILATQGATVAVETTGDLNTWVEIQQVTGQGNSTPVKITLQTDPNVQAKFWRVRVR